MPGLRRDEQEGKGEQEDPGRTKSWGPDEHGGAGKGARPHRTHTSGKTSQGRAGRQAPLLVLEAAEAMTRLSRKSHRFRL